MGSAADAIQILSTVPQWGVFATVATISIILLAKFVWGVIWRKSNEYIIEFQDNQRFSKNGIKIILDRSKVPGSDPIDYIGSYDLYELLLRNREKWESFPDEVAKRCTSMGCPMHRSIQEDMRVFHENAQKALDKFMADAAISRAETLAYVKGITDDVTLLSQHTFPVITRVVEILSRHEQGDGKLPD